MEDVKVVAVVDVAEEVVGLLTIQSGKTFLTKTKESGFSKLLAVKGCKIQTINEYGGLMLQTRILAKWCGGVASSSL